MIVVGLLLIGVAMVLLVQGLWQPSSALLSGSIGASVLAAVVLVVSARRSGGTATRAGPALVAGDQRPWHDIAPSASAGGRGGGTAIPAIPQQGGQEDGAADPDTDADPPDEPAAQQVSAADAVRVSRMSTEVLVVDGRPRYHLAGCVHLLGRDSEPLPVHEAIELGFTPCGLCEPDSALLTEVRRV
jgi:hypothetical protein